VALAERGCHVAIADVNPSTLAETEALLKGYGVRVTADVVDVSKREQVEAWAQSTARAHGGANMIFNNAGVALSGTVADLEISDYEWIMGINFWGVVYGTKAFLPLLEASGEGHVINISSVFGITSQPFMSGYNASKYAVRGFTESLRQDLEISNSCVTATCVHPGGIKTNIARDSRTAPGLAKITGKSNEETARDFERMFRTTPAAAAKTILHAVLADDRRVLIGADARLFDWISRIAPTGYQRIFTSVVRSQTKRS
jgi:NAD(P)-dependent dehydrogenase (short-subunit alcohol dehydrogenase family)